MIRQILPPFAIGGLFLIYLKKVTHKSTNVKFRNAFNEENLRVSTEEYVKIECANVKIYIVNKIDRALFAFIMKKDASFQGAHVRLML